MNRKFLDALYNYKNAFEVRKEQLNKIDVFPDDGHSFEVHKEQLKHAEKMESIFDELIDSYLAANERKAL